MFLSCIVVIKSRSALSWYQTYSTALQFAKLTSAYLFFRMNIYLGLVYCLVCIIRLYFLPDDEIKLPDEITYINDLAECKNTIGCLNFIQHSHQPVNVLHQFLLIYHDNMVVTN